jgi:Holliday junction resolvase RusA-like endonuclease
MAIRKQLGNLRIENPIKCIFYVFAQDKRHDRGNLYVACEKSFLDALQTAHVIRNDGFDDVLDSEFHTYVDRENPRVVVEIIEVERR